MHIGDISDDIEKTEILTHVQNIAHLSSRVSGSELVKSVNVGR